MLTIPGLDTSRRLEELRESSMRSSLWNLRRQARAGRVEQDEPTDRVAAFVAELVAFVAQS